MKKSKVLAALALGVLSFTIFEVGHAEAKPKQQILTYNPNEVVKTTVNNYRVTKGKYFKNTKTVCRQYASGKKACKRYVTEGSAAAMRRK